MQTAKIKTTTQTLTLGAILTALVILMQCLGTYTAFFGPFSTALALVPIVIGAALCGRRIGAWLGFVFSMVVLLTGGANLFITFNPVGTLITVIVKGIACGLAAGVVYKLLNKHNIYIAVIASAAICPIVNTTFFLLGSAVFFLDHANKIADTVKLADISGMDVFYALASANFLFEIAMTVALSPIIITLINIRKKKQK